MGMARGQVAFYCGMILIFGHFAAFALVWLNSSISPSSKSDIVAIIVPLTVASVTSAVLYAMKHGEIDLRRTPKVNAFFFLISTIVPLMFFIILLLGLYQLDGEGSVEDFKAYIVSFEAAFAGIFVVVTEALFSSHKDISDPNIPKDSNKNGSKQITPT